MCFDFVVVFIAVLGNASHPRLFSISSSCTPRAGAAMRVSVLTLGGNELALEVDPGCSLLELKSRIAERTGVGRSRLTLLHRGAPLAPGPLEAAGVAEGAELTLVLGSVRRILTGSEDCTARLWCSCSGECLQTFMGNGHAVCSAAFSPDGASVVTGFDDGTVMLWRADSGDCLLTFTAHWSDLFSVAFSPDGASVVTVFGDRSASIWRVDSGLYEPRR